MFLRGPGRVLNDRAGKKREIGEGVSHDSVINSRQEKERVESRTCELLWPAAASVRSFRCHIALKLELSFFLEKPSISPRFHFQTLQQQAPPPLPLPINYRGKVR